MQKLCLQLAAGAALLILASSAANAFSLEFERNARIEIINNARISMTEAVADAEARIEGIALHAELDDLDGVFLYRINVLKDGALNQISYDLDTGEVIPGAETDAYAAPPVIGDRNISLSEAISAAERHSSGRVSSAGLQSIDGAIRYALDILKDGQRYEVSIDVGSGQILAFDLDETLWRQEATSILADIDPVENGEQVAASAPTPPIYNQPRTPNE